MERKRESKNISPIWNYIDQNHVIEVANGKKITVNKFSLLITGSTNTCRSYWQKKNWRFDY